MLFNTIEEIKKYLPANAAFQMGNISPFIKDAEEAIIIPVLGRDQYNELDTAYNNNVLNANLEKLLDKVRKPLANYSYYKYLPIATVVIGKGSIHVEIDEKKKPLTQWQFLKLEDRFIEAADDGIEDLYVFLEENKDNYTTWRDSDDRKAIRNCFLTSSKEFTEHASIGNSRRTYMAMLPEMKKVQRNHILPILCKELYDEIIEEIKENEISEANAALLEFIRPAVASLTRARALTELSIKINNNGVQLLATSDRENIIVKNPAEVQRITAMQTSDKEDAEAELKKLTDYLYAHADDYLSWKNSSCYIDPTSEDAEPFDQSNNGIVSF